MICHFLFLGCFALVRYTSAGCPEPELSCDVAWMGSWHVKPQTTYTYAGTTRVAALEPWDTPPTTDPSFVGHLGPAVNLMGKHVLHLVGQDASACAVDPNKCGNGFCVRFWVRRNTLEDEGTTSYWAYSGSQQGGASGWEIRLTGGSLIFEVRTATARHSASLSANWLPAAGVWFSLGACYSAGGGGNMRVFVDGLAKVNVAPVATAVTHSALPTNLFFGGNGLDGSGFSDIAIDAIAFHEQVLADADFADCLRPILVEKQCLRDGLHKIVAVKIHPRQAPIGVVYVPGNHGSCRYVRHEYAYVGECNADAAVTQSDDSGKFADDGGIIFLTASDRTAVSNGKNFCGVVVSGTTHSLNLIIAKDKTILQNDFAITVTCSQADFDRATSATASVSSNTNVGIGNGASVDGDYAIPVVLQFVSPGSDTPLTTITVGRRVQLRAELKNKNLGVKGIQMVNCKAVSGDMSTPIERELVDHNGCAATRAPVDASFIGNDTDGSIARSAVFGAFGFNSFSGLRVECQVKFCTGNAEPACALDHCQTTSSRKRRSSDHKLEFHRRFTRQSGSNLLNGNSIVTTSTSMVVAQCLEGQQCQEIQGLLVGNSHGPTDTTKLGLTIFGTSLGLLVIFIIVGMLAYKLVASQPGDRATVPPCHRTQKCDTFISCNVPA